MKGRTEDLKRLDVVEEKEEKKSFRERKAQFSQKVTEKRRISRFLGESNPRNHRSNEVK